MRYERQIHHYGSGLNALPLIAAFEASPTDYYLLRAGFGGLSGPLSNIDEDGFAAASFVSVHRIFSCSSLAHCVSRSMLSRTLWPGTLTVETTVFQSVK